jgi:hypothetical protein
MRLKPETLAAHRRRVAKQLDELMSQKTPQEPQCTCADCQCRKEVNPISPAEK